MSRLPTPRTSPPPVLGLLLALAFGLLPASGAATLSAQTAGHTQNAPGAPGAPGMATPPDPTAAPCAQSYSGLAYRLEERDGTDTQPVCPDRKTPVDPNSLLLLQFTPPAAPGGAGSAQGQAPELAPDLAPEQQQLLDTLEEANGMARQLAQDYADLNRATPDLTDPTAVQTFQDRLRAFDRRLLRFLRSLDALGIDWPAILQASPDRPYRVLGRRLQAEIERLDRNLQRFLAGRERLELTVQAFHLPYGAAQRPIHVEPYDTIPAGELRPLPKVGLRLSERERERLEQGLRFNESVAGLIRDSREALENLRETAASVFSDLDGQLQQLASSLERLAAEWPEGLDRAATALRQRAEGTGLPEDDRKTLEQLAADLEAVGGAVEELRQARSSIEGVRSRLRGTGGGQGDPDGSVLASLLFAGDGLLDRVETLGQTLQDLGGSVRDVRERLDRIRAGAGRVAGVLEDEVRERLLPQVLPDGTRTALEQVGTGVLLAETLTGTLKNASTSAALTGPVGDARVRPAEDARSEWLSLADPPDARIDLQRLGWLPGEELWIKVRFRERREGGGGELRHLETYILEATPMGWYRRVSSNLIFARAVDGEEGAGGAGGGGEGGEGGDGGDGGGPGDAEVLTDAEDWKPNVAALVNWHYHVRNPSGPLQRFWNGLDLGLGLHLASLDQTDDSVEFGIGLSFELWNGLLTGGYGYNLSRSSDADYLFVGLDLFEVLNRSQRGEEDLARPPGR